MSLSVTVSEVGAIPTNGKRADAKVNPPLPHRDAPRRAAGRRPLDGDEREPRRSGVPDTVFYSARSTPKKKGPLPCPAW